MARTNKYASLNFNDIYEKKIINNTNPTTNNHSSSLTNPKTIISNSRIHGNMLVLSRPTPKPIPQPSQTPPPPQQQTQRPITPDQARVETDLISLRPLGKTGSGLSISQSPNTFPVVNKEREVPVSPKPDKFVPPHLRPGYVCREEKPGPEFQKQQPPANRFRDFSGYRQGHFGYGEEGRPKSGGGYERMRRGVGSGLGEMNRPGSGGSRPTSSG